MDSDEQRWVKRLLYRKQREDLNTMQNLFLIHMSKLLDATIRKHYTDLCYKCLGTKGEHFHICLDQTASIVIAFGDQVLEYATCEEKQKTWVAFLNEVADRDIFKKVILKWLKEFRGIEEEVNENRDIYHQYMLRHFPNETMNPHLAFLDFHDIDEIDG